MKIHISWPKEVAWIPPKAPLTTCFWDGQKWVPLTELEKEEQERLIIIECQL